MTAAGPAGMPALLGEVGRVMDGIFASLDELGSSFAALTRTAPEPDDLRSLHPTIHALLRRHGGLVTGAGVVVAPGILAAPRHWLEWWWTTPSGATEALRVALDPDRADFFDYTQADWYATPRSSGHRHASGPYVDHLCTNAYTVTLTAPVRRGEHFVGVAGADILVSSLEAVALPLLGRIGPETALCNGAGRVVAAHSSAVTVGDRLGGAGSSSVHRALTPTARWSVRRLGTR